MTTCKSGKSCQKQQFPKKIGKTICQICQTIFWNNILQNFDSARPFAKFATNSSGKKLSQKSLQPNHDLPKDLPRRECKLHGLLGLVLTN